jgi:glycosyltransferase involved in cell wall biosynthesis
MDILFISLLKSVHAKSKVFLTVHNLTPHNVTGAALDSFMDIFEKVMRHIDGFIVHTSSTKGEFCSLFDVNPEKVSVVRHGIFDKGELPPRINTDSSVCNVLMYGTQSFYKGTDILVDSLTYLPENVRQQLSVKIVGMTDQIFYNEHSDKAKELGVEWRNALISDEELKELLSWSDVIVLPYRKISQSGVLLETIYYEKPLIISDMPSFVETLSGYEQAMIFKAGDSKELSQSLNNFVSGNLDMDLVFNVIKTKKAEYSWENSAKQTIFAYLYNC